MIFIKHTYYEIVNEVVQTANLLQDSHLSWIEKNVEWND